MKQNIGIAGRYVRLVTGILALNCSANTHRRNHLGRNLLASFGAMKIAEGVIGWCPTVEICNRLFSVNGSSTNNKSLTNIQHSAEQKPQVRSSESEHKSAEQNQKPQQNPHDSDHPNSQGVKESKLAESKIVQSDKNHSESGTNTETEAEIEAF